MTVFPGAAQHDSVALQTLDRYALGVLGDPDQRCTQSASQTRVNALLPRMGSREMQI
jgi:hypothetical protein